MGFQVLLRLHEQGRKEKQILWSIRVIEEQTAEEEFLIIVNQINWLVKLPRELKN